MAVPPSDSARDSRSASDVASIQCTSSTDTTTGLPTRAVHQPPHRFECLGANELWRRQGGHGRLTREEESPDMEARIVAEAQRFASRPDPGLDCGGRLVAGQPARISHDRRDRQVGDRAPVGEAGATEDRPAATALVELEKDPRLADPRLAHDAHDLAVA